jgi:hypothetical protein
MTKLQRFIPQTPDPYLKQSNQLGAVKFGHLNSLVDAINATIYGDYLQLAGDGPMSTTLRALEDPVGNLAQLYLAIDKTAISGPLKIGNSDPNVSSAILQIDSTTQGILFPRLTQVQRDAILSPETGLIIYNSTDSILNIWDGAQWTEIGGGGGLDLKDGLLMTSALTEVVDKENTESALLLSTNRVGISADPAAITQATAVIQASTLNSGIAIVPNGTGAITADIPDGTNAGGGNSRGPRAVDLQMSRYNAVQVASGADSFIGGGANSRATAQYSVVVGGNQQAAVGLGSFVGSGFNNASSGTESSTVGGNSNTSRGNYSFVGGGQLNDAGSGSHTTISGGSSNIASSQYSTISGGQSNTTSTGSHATVVGGQGNTSSGQWSVSGGSSNNATGQGSVALGWANTTSGFQAPISLGYQNNNSGNIGALALGYNNAVSGFGGVAIGSNNISAASFTFGSDNRGSASFALALGYRSSTYLYGQNAISSGYFATQGDAQQSTLVARKFDDLTTGGTTVLSLDGTGTTNLIIPTGNNRVWNVKVETIAVVTGTSGTTDGVSVGDSLMQDDTILFTKVSGTSSVVGVNNTNIIASTSMGTAGMSFTAGASQELAITFTAPTFTGGGSVTCRVVSKVSLVEVAW